MQRMSVSSRNTARANPFGVLRSRIRGFWRTWHTSVMASRLADSAAQGPSQPSDRSRARKRKLGSPTSPATLSAAASELQSEVGMASTGPEGRLVASAAANGDNGALPRGQPLQEFVEKWEFRWDMQRKEYPWEWASDSRLSDGPHNIIRCARLP